MKLAWTLVTLASFAALPAVAQDTDADADAEDIEEVVDDVLDADTDGDGPIVELPRNDLPVTLPEPAAAQGDGLI